MHPKGQDYPAAFRTVNATKEGNYVIDGLEPGVWVFSVWPGALSTSTEVIVSASQRGLDQDLRWASQ